MNLSKLFYNKINIVDLFAGCGGLSEGFEKVQGYNSLAFVEWEKYPCLTLKKRLKEKWGYNDIDRKVLNFDIQRTNELINGWTDYAYGKHDGLKSVIGSQNVNMIIGGPPCQAYSIAGRVRDENGMKYDYRNYLFEAFLEIVNIFKPELFVFENVEGILTSKPGGIPVTERISKKFY